MKAIENIPVQTCLELAMELSRAPEFFDLRGNPNEALTRQNGKRLTQDSERCLMAGALRLLACSDRQIAEVMKCDTRSIPLMLEEAERSGRIPALKDRLTKLTGRNAEASQLALRGLLQRAIDGGESIELSAMIKAVATAGGIATQNLQLLTGQATEILDVRVAGGGRLAPGREEIEAWAKANAIDCESSELPAKPKQTEGETKRDTVPDTAGSDPAQAAGPTGGGDGAGRGAPSADPLPGLQILDQEGRP